MYESRSWTTTGTVFMVVVGWCLTGANVHAQERLFRLGPGIKFGPLELHPGLTAEVIYDDNIFLEESDEESDLITRLVPLLGITLRPPRVGTRRIRLSVTYAPGINLFGDNASEDFVSHDVLATLVYDPPGGLLFTLTERFLHTSEPSSSEEQSATGEARLPRHQNDVGFGVAYSISSRSEIELLFARTDHVFDREFNDNLNRNENTITLTVFRRFLPKTSALVAYSFKYTDFVDLEPDELNKDNHQHAVRVGLRFDPTAKVSGRLTVGYAIKIFADDTLPNGQSFDDKEHIFTTATELTWQARRRTQVILLVSRDFRESSTRGASSFNRTLVELGLEQRFPFADALSAALRGSYERDDFNTIDRQDDIFRAEVHLRYRVFAWLSVGGGYEFVTKSSDDPTVEYDVNRFIFTASGQW